MLHLWLPLSCSLLYHRLLVSVVMPIIALPMQPWMCMLSKMLCVACQHSQFNGVHGVPSVR